MAKKTSTGSADYLRTTQLFSQEDSQTQDLNDTEGSAEEQRIQNAFLEATKRAGRRVTFDVAVDEEVRAPEEGDELASGDKGSDDLDTTSVIQDIIANFDRGAAQFAIEVQAHPDYVYNLLGRLCGQLHQLKETNDLLHQSNARNMAVRTQLSATLASNQELLEGATAKITELSQEHDLQLESRSVAQLGKMKDKNQWYVNTLKEKESVVNKLNDEAAELAAENDDLSSECKRLEEELKDAEQARSWSHSRTSHSRTSHYDPSASLSPYSRAHNMGPPLLPPGPCHQDRHQDRQHRRTARSESRNTDIARRARREDTAATNNTVRTNVSTSSVHVDPNSKSSIQVDCSIKDPDKFKGMTSTYYPWLTSMTLKLSTAVFREEADGLRYVQGFLSDAPWALVAPRIPGIGGWGKPCPNPFASVDELMKLLTERYGEDNTEERAMNAMTALRQGDKEDFNVFYAKYQEYQAYHPMKADRQETHRLQGKLNSRFRDKLADGMECASTQDLVNRCTRLQNQWESIDAEKASKRSDSKGQGGRRKRKDKDDDASSGSGSGPPRHITLPESELPREFKNLPPLTTELRASLRESRGCYKCRKSGHTAAMREKCPLAILEDAYEKRTNRVNQVQVEGIASNEQQHPGNGTATR